VKFIRGVKYANIKPNQPFEDQSDWRRTTTAAIVGTVVSGCFTTELIGILGMMVVAAGFKSQALWEYHLPSPGAGWTSEQSAFASTKQ